MVLRLKGFENDFISMIRKEKYDLIQTNSIFDYKYVFLVPRIEFINQQT